MHCSYTFPGVAAGPKAQFLSLYVSSLQKVTNFNCKRAEFGEEQRARQAQFAATGSVNPYAPGDKVWFKWRLYGHHNAGKAWRRADGVVVRALPKGGVVLRWADPKKGRADVEYRAQMALAMVVPVPAA
jgi:hypothetical protein